MTMKNFSGVTFRGTFRSYQSRILKEADQYKKDGHIHIVAAPGSGKTILGLELIRQLGQPALILAPTITIRQQWGERFEESFLPKGEDIGDYFSTRTDKPKLMTCLTYQALFSAMQGIGEESNAKIDLPSILKKAGITTLCLDEAHHLRNEWYQSIIELKEKAGISFQTIALTATPPYDSTPAEWKKYIGLCGEIDAEISTPELVAQKTLCPHQDFVYFSKPTESEAQLIRKYRTRASQMVEKLHRDRLLSRALEAAVKAPDTDEIFYGKPAEARAFLFAAMQEGYSIPKRFRSFLFERRNELRRKSGILQKKLLPEEMAYQFILDHPDCFTEEIAKELRSVLKENGFLERNRVSLISSTELKKMLASSMGKLEGIRVIVRNEKSVMGESLRMVILTDYIRREFISKIGSGEETSKMGAVPIFETLRSSPTEDGTLGVLSGSTVILPDQAKEETGRLAGNEGCSVSFSPLSDTGYSSVSFSGGNKEKVRIVTALFRTGFIQVLIGTTALLGEGWDSPCVNSLILASFVGSFMLSNQMRGRAIRIDPEHPRKVAVIWHLITPDSSSPYLGEDFISVSRRFDSFLAPDFREDRIRSGIDRLGIRSDMNIKELDDCNREMLQTDRNREGIRFFSPKKLFCELAESVFLAMRDVKLIESEDIRVVTTADPDGIFISCMLRGGTIREKVIYAEAIREMLTPMASPRYVILRDSLFALKGRFSFPCPSILGKSAKLAECLEKRLNQKLGHCHVFYTRNDAGHRLYKKCVKRSFINYQFDYCTLSLKRQEVY